MSIRYNPCSPCCQPPPSPCSLWVRVYDRLCRYISPLTGATVRVQGPNNYDQTRTAISTGPLGISGVEFTGIDASATEYTITVTKTGFATRTKTVSPACANGIWIVKTSLWPLTFSIGNTMAETFQIGLSFAMCIYAYTNPGELFRGFSFLNVANPYGPWTSYAGIRLSFNSYSAVTNSGGNYSIKDIPYTELLAPSVFTLGDEPNIQHLVPRGPWYFPGYPDDPVTPCSGWPGDPAVDPLLTRPTTSEVTYDLAPGYHCSSCQSPFPSTLHYSDCNGSTTLTWQPFQLLDPGVVATVYGWFGTMTAYGISTWVGGADPWNPGSNCMELKTIDVTYNVAMVSYGSIYGIFSLFRYAGSTSGPMKDSAGHSCYNYAGCPNSVTVGRLTGIAAPQPKTMPTIAEYKAACQDVDAFTINFRGAFFSTGAPLNICNADYLICDATVSV